MRLCFSISIVSALALLFAAAAAADPLWQKAVEIAGRSLERLPTRAFFRLELPRNGGPASGTFLTWYRLSRDGQGNIVMETLRAVNNGVDIAPGERDGQEKLFAGERKKGVPPFDLGNNPFDPSAQQSISVSALRETRRVGARSCAGFRYSFRKADKSLQEGIAWIDRATGAPVEAAFTMKPLPPFVLSMTTTMGYGAVAADDGALRESTVEGVAGLLFVRQRFRTTVTLSGYSPLAYAAP